MRILKKMDEYELAIRNRSLKISWAITFIVLLLYNLLKDRTTISIIDLLLFLMIGSYLISTLIFKSQTQEKSVILSANIIWTFMIIVILIISGIVLLIKV